MNLRQLGNTDLKLSEVGFGAWALGGGGYAFGWGPQDDRDSIAAVRRAVELGVNWIDTAPVYGLGRSERVVGRAIEPFRGQVLVATKCTRRWTAQGEIYGDMSAAGIKAECEESLRRLGVERIDLYQIHWPDPEGKLEEAWAAIADLIQEGKVRWGGVSNFTAAQMARAQAIHPLASLQPPYSMLRRRVEGEEFAFCRAHGIGVLAYSPMQAGLLTGRFDLIRVAADDWRRRSVEFNEPNLSVNLQLVDALRPLAAKYDKTVAQLAVAWVLRDRVVTSAIVGARRPEQIEETVGGAGWTIAEEDLREIERLLAWRRARLAEVGGTVRD